MKLLKYILGFSLLISIWHCAQRVPITGGDKDTTPPKLLRSNPDTFATNFSADKIRLEFDEFVDVSGVRQNLLITPIFREDPNVVVSGKKVIIKNIDDSLWPNTTYVMEFNEAIIDITERNPAKGFRYVFSTGDYVDSLMVFGEVKSAFTLAPVEDVFVFLYTELDDSIPYKEPPRYIGRTNKEGLFSIKNMKPGTYKAFACSDDNKNYLFDLPGEKIDFLDVPINVGTDTVNTLTFKTFSEASEIQYLKGFSSLSPWSFYISYNLRIDTLEVLLMDKDKEFSGFARSYELPHDSVVFWNLDSLNFSDTLNLLVKADDYPTDTIQVIFDVESKKENLGLKRNVKGGNLDLGNDLEFYFDHPLLSVDTSLMRMEEDSVPKSFTYELNPTKRTLRIKSDWKPNKQYVLSMDTASIVDINGFANDSVGIKFSTQKTTYYGTLDISIDVPLESQGILIIMDKTGKEIEQVYLDKTNKYYFKYLHPGEYLLKYILDENGNGKWDPGKYMDKRHAEKVYIYQKTITIRSNWDQVIEWKL